MSESPPSPQVLAEQLAEATNAGGDVDQLVLSWTARTLIEVDAAARGWRFTWSHQRRLIPHEVPLLSMTHDGHCREAAVRMLSSRPGVASDRLLALRLGDHVLQVRRTAWQALLARPARPQLAVVVPVLIALRGRVVSSTALDDYARTVEPRLGHPLWHEFLEHPDRETRRWAVTEQIARGMDPGTALEQLDQEQDLFLVRDLVEVAVRSQEVAHGLLNGRTAFGRRRALEVLPASALSIAQIEQRLLDRSPMVRRMAALRAEGTGIDARAWYRGRWRATQDQRALAGLWESGDTLDREDALALVRSESIALRRLGLRFLARLGVERDDLPLLWELIDDPVASQLVHTLARSSCWEWGDAADRWQGADERMRLRLWRLLSSRGGWDEVRAHLLATTDPWIAALGRSGLDSWAMHRASRMYHSPTPEQRNHIVALLEAAEIPAWQRERISFIAGLD